VIRETGQVVSVDGNMVTVATSLKQGCGGCQQQNHCGAGLLSKAFPQRQRNLQFPMTKPPSPGAEVEVLLPESVMLKFSLMLYLLPLLALLAGAGVTRWLVPGPEWPAILAGAAAMWLCFRSLKSWLNSRDIQVRELVEVRTVTIAD